MARKTKEELDILMKKHGVKQLWSWSRYNCYKNSPYEYYLKYILHEESDAEPSIYGVLGGRVHEIIEGYYLEETKYEEMLDKYEEALFELQMQGLKYNKVDEEANLNIGNKYEACVREFFKNHIPLKEKAHIEKFIDIKVGKYVFQGYIDCVTKIGEDVCIIDWKTSTEYKGEKALKEIGQLKLYAYGLMKKGISADKIRMGWCFIKLYTFTYTQKNGKEKSMNIERNIDPLDIPSIRNNVESNLKSIKDDNLYFKFEELPTEIKNLYKIEDCYTMFQFTEDELEEFAKYVECGVDEIISRTNEWEKENIGKSKENYDDSMWMGEVIDAKNLYYMNNLCSYTFRKHKPFSEYIEMSRMFMNED